MRSANNWLPLIIIGFSFTTVSPIVPQFIGYLLTAGIIGICFIWVSRSGLFRAAGTKSTILAVGYFVVVLFGHAIVRPGLETLPRTLAFGLLTPLLLFVFPTETDRSVVFHRFSVLTSIIVFISLPTLFIDQIGAGPFSVTSWQTTGTIPILDLEYNRLRGIFRNPNTLSIVCVVGAVSVLNAAKFDEFSRYLFAMNALGVYLSGSRTALLTLVAALMLFTIHSLLGDQITIISSISGILAVLLIAVFSVFELVPIDLTGREYLWPASIHAILQQPLIGYGPVDLTNVIYSHIQNPSVQGLGPHNSFLVPFLIGGIFAGISYIVIILSAYKSSIYSTIDSNNIVLHLLVVVVAVVSVFNGSTIFGTSTISVITALIIGYALAQTGDKEMKTTIAHRERRER